jgi:hypothetical protein
VVGNYIGTDRTGASALPNGYGVHVFRSKNSLIGNGAADGRNVIAGNNGDGIGLWNGSAWEGDRWTTGTRILGNYIGVSADGLAPLGNKAGDFGGGIAIRNYVASTTVGSPTPGHGNVIAFNSPAGIAIFSGLGTAVRGNSIMENSGLGIDLDLQHGRTANDPEDTDRGGNNLQNFPVLISALVSASGELVLDYVVSSSPVHSTYPMTVDFYEADTPQNGQGRTFLGTATLPRPGTSSANLGSAGRLGITEGDAIVAVATDGRGNSSEFGPPATAVVQSAHLAARRQRRLTRPAPRMVR